MGIKAAPFSRLLGMSHVRCPPSPVVVTTIPDYFGGRPTPPPSPLHDRTTLTIDDYAPCPPSPHHVPSSPQQDALQRPDSPIPWLTSELDHSTVFADLLDETRRDQAGYDDPHVSDCLIYTPEIYASPSPVLVMIQRATLDNSGLLNQPVNPSACDRPRKLFSLTCGYIPRTGLDAHDRPSYMYYAKYPFPRLPGYPESSLSYIYPISAIEAVQHSLHTDWSLVFPGPIPVIIIRSCDIVGPFAMAPRLDGFAFTMPTRDSIWPTVCWRGVDSTFRPLNPSATVENTLCRIGESLYWPQHIVASKFAVNVFLQLGDLATHCEYLGAYVMQMMETLTMHSAVWADLDPQVQRSVCDRVPYHVQDRPTFPYVRFHYYKWDQQIIGLADETYMAEIVQIDSDDSFEHTDSGFDSDLDTLSTLSTDSPEPEDTSFLDLSPGA